MSRISFHIRRTLIAAALLLLSACVLGLALAGGAAVRSGHTARVLPHAASAGARDGRSPAPSSAGGAALDSSSPRVLIFVVGATVPAGLTAMDAGPTESERPDAVLVDQVASAATARAAWSDLIDAETGCWWQGCSVTLLDLRTPDEQRLLPLTP